MGVLPIPGQVTEQEDRSTIYTCKLKLYVLNAHSSDLYKEVVLQQFYLVCGVVLIHRLLLLNNFYVGFAVQYICGENKNIMCTQRRLRSACAFVFAGRLFAFRCLGSDIKSFS